MKEISTTIISSKGQIVLPKEMRKELNLKEGNILAVIREDSMIVLKKMNNPMLTEEIATLKRIEEAWEDIEKGKCRSLSAEEFLKEIKRW